MNKAIAFALISSVLVSGCSGKRELHVYTWSDYINPELIERFERENDCRVIIDTFDDNEMLLAKLQSGATGYDVIFPSSYVVPVLIRQGLLAPLDTNRLGNVVRNFNRRYFSVTHEYTMAYSVPYAFSMTGIAYRSDRIGTNSVRRSWDFLKNPAFAHRVSILNDMREVLGAGLKACGRSLNATRADELEKAVGYALTLKAVANRLDSVQYRTGLVNGEFYAAMGYNSDVFQIRQENPGVKIGFFVPDEGGACCWDEMVVMRGSDLDLSHKFIDFLYDPEVAAQNIDYAGAIPNAGMSEFLPKEILEDELVFPGEDTLKNLELIRDIGDSLEVYSRMWDVFMAK